MHPPDDAPPPWRKFYGRRRGKRLRPAQLRLLDELLPRLRVPGALTAGDPEWALIDTVALFGDGRPVWLEIGFGAGEHLVHQASAHSEVGLFGCEPFVNGVAAALGRIAAAGVQNVRLHPGDARDLVERLPEAALTRVFLLYPDPWPKTRHVRRRFIGPENLALLGRVMAPGAELRLATDIPAYVAHALAAVEAAPAFRVMPGSGRDLHTPWEDWPGTRYEAKARAAGRRPHYLSFVRA